MVSTSTKPKREICTFIEDRGRCRETAIGDGFCFKHWETAMRAESTECESSAMARSVTDVCKKLATVDKRLKAKSRSIDRLDHDISRSEFHLHESIMTSGQYCSASL